MHAKTTYRFLHEAQCGFEGIECPLDYIYYPLDRR